MVIDVINNNKIIINISKRLARARGNQIFGLC